MRFKIYFGQKYMFGPYPVRYFGFDLHRMFIGISWWGDKKSTHISETLIGGER